MVAFLRKVSALVVAAALILISSVPAFAAVIMDTPNRTFLDPTSGFNDMNLDLPYFTNARFQILDNSGLVESVDLPFSTETTGHIDLTASNGYDYVHTVIPSAGYYSSFSVSGSFSGSHFLYSMDSIRQFVASSEIGTDIFGNKISDFGYFDLIVNDLFPSYITYNITLRSNSSVFPDISDIVVYLGSAYQPFTGYYYSVGKDFEYDSYTTPYGNEFIHTLTFTIRHNAFPVSNNPNFLHNVDIFFDTPFNALGSSISLSSVGHDDYFNPSPLVSKITSLFDHLISTIVGIDVGKDENYQAVTDPSTSQEIQDTQHMIDSVESFEASLNQNITTEFNKIDFTTPTNLAAPVAYVGDKVTRSINALGNYQPLIFVPLTLGIMLIFLGRGASSLGALTSRRSERDLAHDLGLDRNKNDERWLW